MKRNSVTILILSLAFASSGSLSRLGAQDASVSSNPEIQRCVNWIKATVPNTELREPDPVNFCSGVQSDDFGGWSAVFKCGTSLALRPGATPSYCASFGYIGPHETWAAEFSSTTKDGRELLEESPANDSQRNAVTFYSSTPMWMGSVRIAAGMYQLIPSKSADGWSLAVTRQDGDGNQAKPAQQNLGTVAMKASAPQYPMGKDYLEIWARPFSNQCGSESTDYFVRELHFILGSTDLSVCMRPEPAAQPQQASVSEQ